MSRNRLCGTRPVNSVCVYWHVQGRNLGSIIDVVYMCDFTPYIHPRWARLIGMGSENSASCIWLANHVTIGGNFNFCLCFTSNGGKLIFCFPLP